MTTAQLEIVVPADEPVIRLQPLPRGQGPRPIDPPRRLVRTFVYEPWPDASLDEWLELEPVEGGTMLRGGSKHPSIESRDRHVESGMEQGIRESMERLDELLPEL